MGDRALNAFLDAVHHDPLFAAEGMDLEGGNAALDAIEAICAEFESISGRDSLARRVFLLRYPLATHALPIPFVRSFIESERERRRFLAYPTRKAAERLLAVWSTTQRALDVSISRYLALHRILFRLYETEGTPQSAENTLGYIRTPEDTEVLIRSMKENASVLLRDIKARAALLRGESSVSLSPSRRKPDPVFFPTIIPGKYTRLHELELKDGFPYRNSTIIETHGPINYSVSAFDGVSTPHVFNLYVLRDKQSGLRHIKVAILDFYTFVKIGEGAKNYNIVGRAAFQTLIERGIPYWYQCATHLYTMGDQRYWADVATIIDLGRRPHLDRRLVLAQRSSLFDLILGACWEDHTILLKHTKEAVAQGKFLPKVWHHFVSRTHPSLYYLPFNASVWRTSSEADFLGSRQLPPGERRSRLVDEVLPLLSDRELELVMEGGRIREDERTRAWENYIGR